MTISEIYDLFKECKGVTTDSRFVHKDNMFFSLKGPNFNGNKYAKSAIEKGAKYAIVDDKEYAFDSQYIVVNNSLETLQKLSNYHRNISNIKPRTHIRPIQLLALKASRNFDFLMSLF